MKFKYKFSTVNYVIFIAMYALGAVCFGWNLVRLLQSLSSEVQMDTYKIISTVLCLILPILIGIFITAMICSSYYKITDTHVEVKFGFLGDKYKLCEMANVIKNVKTDVLVINFTDESLLRVVIEKSKFDDFSAEIIKKNKSIAYGETDEAPSKK